jgi:hypothetical protein
VPGKSQEAASEGIYGCDVTVLARAVDDTCTAAAVKAAEVQASTVTSQVLNRGKNRGKNRRNRGKQAGAVVPVWERGLPQRLVDQRAYCINPFQVKYIKQQLKRAIQRIQGGGR